MMHFAMVTLEKRVLNTAKTELMFGSTRSEGGREGGVCSSLHNAGSTVARKTAAEER